MLKYNELQAEIAPLLLERGEQNKIKALFFSPSSNLFPLKKALMLV